MHKHILKIWGIKSPAWTSWDCRKNPEKNSLRRRENRAKHGSPKSTYVARLKDKDPERLKLYYREHNLKNKFGISLGDFEEMLQNQGGVCLICKGPPTGKGDYHVDHDHITQKIRGLLCHGCNTGIGSLKDSPELLEAAANYIRKHRS
jgi:hypothetical protein